MTWTATETGTVYVVARGHRDDTGTYTLSVTDISPQAQQQETVNAAPAFGQESYSFDLAENADGALFGHELGPVVASDADNDPITYSIVGGDPDGLFYIEAGTGFLLYVGTGEDYESGPASYELTVRASDGTAHSDVAVTVTVTDVEDDAVSEQEANQAPQFASASYAFALDENVAGDTVPLSLGLVQATDPDDDQIEYSIEGGNAAGLFTIDSETGALSYVGTGEDYESGTTSHELTVRASDGTAHSDVTVTVSVSDLEDYVISEQTANQAPQFTYGSYAFSLPENAAGDTVPLALGLVQATDPNDDPVEYSIEGGNAAGLFAIDSATGALSYVGAGEDYEAGVTQFELTLRASDGSLHSDATVTVNVTDVPEQAIVVASCTRNAAGCVRAGRRGSSHRYIDKRTGRCRRWAGHGHDRPIRRPGRVRGGAGGGPDLRHRSQGQPDGRRHAERSLSAWHQGPGRDAHCRRIRR